MMSVGTGRHNQNHSKIYNQNDWKQIQNKQGDAAIQKIKATQGEKQNQNHVFEILLIRGQWGCGK